MMPSKVQEMTANIVIVTTALISMISTSIIIFQFIKHKSRQNILFSQNMPQFEFFMIFTLCLSDFLEASSKGIPVIYYWATNQFPMDESQYTNSIACKTQAFIQLMSCLGQFIWTFNIAYSIYRGLFPETEEQYQIRKKILTITGFGIPIIFSCLPLIGDNYGQNSCGETICFIVTGDSTGNAYVVLIFGVPMMQLFNLNSSIYMMLNFILFFYVLKRIKKIVGPEITYSIDIKLMIYPLILILCQGWFCIYYLSDVLFQISWINYQIWCYATSNLMGFFDTVCYGFNSKTDVSMVDSNAYSLLTQPLSANNSVEKQMEM